MTTHERRSFRQDLSRELRKFPASKVRIFIGKVVLIVTHSEIHFPSELERAEAIRLTLARVLDLQKTLSSNRNKLYPMPFPTRVGERMSNIAAADARIQESFFRSKRQMEDAAHAFLKELRKAETRTETRGRGRPAADSIGTLAAAARHYFDVFGERPTTTPGATFSNVATLILRELTGTAPEDISRQVRAAVRSI